MRISKWLLLVLLGFAGFSQAVELEGFYSAKVIVEDRSKAEFNKGIENALVRVLAKASGKQEDTIRQNPSLAYELGIGSRLASHFLYVEEEVNISETETVKRLFLKAGFPEKTVINMLQKGQLALWSSNRPQVVVWPIIKLDGKTQLAKGQNFMVEQFLQTLQEEAELKGLPIIIPNALKLGLKDYWQWNKEAIRSVSQSFKADATLSLRVALTGDGRAIGGGLYLDGEDEKSWDINSDTANEFARRVISYLAEVMAQKYAVKLDARGNEVVISLSGVNDFNDYKSTLNYFESLDTVEELFLLNAEQDQITFVLALKSSREQFIQSSLNSGKVAVNDADVNSAFVISMQWVDQ